ncbi:YbgA family protein [Alteribacter keqinensis]|uniref:DUF1722 domain-containing protein n=1 Tax=Alteribacter keqinensis TaxID=2483800 RepID=A0A3M7TUC6_9BACI|nr:DUF523 and DUF1722 domain-containing protein [Alteribacter keqinensis]RNA69240.1 DUF1722 domain-containing protein [Alteribacter keqinensis]
MRMFKKPRIVVSKCLEFEPCRYDGAKIKSDAVSKLMDSAELIPVCPEVEIGLSTPRESIRIIESGDEERLVLPSGKEDLTDQMKSFSDSFLTNLRDVDGFILKGRSPSCGIFDTKVYAGYEKSPVIKKSAGIFAKKVIDHFPDAVIEDDGRLRNFSIREHFLTRIYTLSEFRDTKSRGDLESLNRFHARNKYLFLSYHPKLLKDAGRIIANYEKRSKEEIYSSYEAVLGTMMKKKPKFTSNINVCQHILSFFKGELSVREKEHFLYLLQQYSERRIPLSNLTSILKSWVYRFEREYLFNQSYFEPYPESLIEITDSGKGRNY